MMKAMIMSLALAAGVSAHGAVTSYSVGSTTYPGYNGFAPSSSYTGAQFQWPDYNPTGFDDQTNSHAFSSNVRCNGGTSAPGHITAAAGSQISAYWAQWTHNPSTVAVYLYEVSDWGESLNGQGWFKIDEYVSSGSTLSPDTNWAGYKIIKDGKWTSTIPANLKAGKYVIRHELIARHQANNPQFYAECANIEITGSGTATPDSSYKAAIPGTNYGTGSNGCSKGGPPGAGTNLCFEVNGSSFATANYVNIGPKVWGGSGGNPNPNPTTTTTTRTTTTTTQQQPNPTTTTSTRTTTSSTRTTTTTTTTRPATTGTGAPLYGQCGGQGWNGATTCASGTCKYSNPYYSQCLP